MKMIIKQENEEFLVITLKHVSCLKVVVNHPRTIKLWEIAHENSNKTRKLRVLGHISQTRNGSYRPSNPTRTQKLWVIAHENCHKTRNDEFLVISLKHVSVSYEACKSAWNPKTMGNNSWK